MIIKFLLIASLAFLLLACHTTPKNAFRPMSEMKGDCANYKADISQELKMVKSEGHYVETAQKVGGEVISEIKIGKFLLQLHPEQKEKLFAPPTKSFERKNPFSGWVYFKPQTSQNYRISTGKRVWLEVIDKDTKQKVPSQAFEMQMQCKEIFKVVEFNLSDKKDYVIQVSSSEDQELTMYLQPGSLKK